VVVLQAVHLQPTQPQIQAVAVAVEMAVAQVAVGQV
jgi:hypothetical protein